MGPPPALLLFFADDMVLSGYNNGSTAVQFSVYNMDDGRNADGGTGSNRVFWGSILELPEKSTHAGSALLMPRPQ